MTEINSKNNSKIKDLIKLRDDSKFRNDKSLFYVEGERIISDSPKELIDSIYIQKSKLENFKRIINRYNDSQIFLIDDDIFNKIKDTINSQGIIAVVKYNCIKNLSNNYLENIQNCLLLDNVNDPGNLGTIIRLAEATNISLIILCNSCCNLYNPKVIRSCMSSLFRVNIYISDDISNAAAAATMTVFFILFFINVHSSFLLLFYITSFYLSSYYLVSSDLICC